MAAPVVPRWLRHALVRHRRWLSGGCAFLAVLFGLSAVQSPPPSAGLPAERHGAPTSSAETLTTRLDDANLVAAPVRLADADVASLLEPGGLIDLIAADGGGRAVIVAGNVEVLGVPTPSDDSFGDTGFGGALVVVAVSSAQAIELAATSAVGPLSVVLRG